MATAADRRKWRDQKRRQREQLKKGLVTLPVPLSCERIDALLTLAGLPQSAATDLRRLGEAARDYLEAGVKTAFLAREKSCPPRTSKPSEQP